MSGLGWNDFIPPREVERTVAPVRAERNDDAPNAAPGCRRLVGKLRVLLVAVVAAFALTAGAFAYFTSSGSGAAAATVGTLAAATPVNARTYAHDPLIAYGNGRGFDSVWFTVNLGRFRFIRPKDVRQRSPVSS